MALSGYFEISTAEYTEKHCSHVGKSGMSRLVGLTTYRLWPSKILLVTGALPLAGGISAKSTNWSDKIVSTNNYASRRSRTRDTVKLTVCVSVCLSVCVCVYSSYNCSTVTMRRKLTASIGF